MKVKTEKAHDKTDNQDSYEVIGDNPEGNRIQDDHEENQKKERKSNK
ncbi:hypothetical protein [Bacillus sp. CECT 9360]|nr:hypothetical protein [Bacillus sp. CECT 9360]CAH0346618.1 hypothetical protein BCI9360_02961 [Bacillus sp. CECT 9360]